VAILLNLVKYKDGQHCENNILIVVIFTSAIYVQGHTHHTLSTTIIPVSFPVIKTNTNVKVRHLMFIITVYKLYALSESESYKSKR